VESRAGGGVQEIRRYSRAFSQRSFTYFGKCGFMGVHRD
jgi:hypothetical protein